LAARGLVGVARGAAVVEAAGYLYHRFFMHAAVFKSEAFHSGWRNHWEHHMMVYPIEHYKRRPPYHESAKDLSLIYAGPTVLIAVAAIMTMGLRPETIAFFVGAAVYLKLGIDGMHARFHMSTGVARGAYFRWAEAAHEAHHADHRTNFSLVCPITDIIFGTYCSPKDGAVDRLVSERAGELTLSDFVNWTQLLSRAASVDKAAFVSQAHRHPRSLRKLSVLIALLRRRLARGRAERGTERLLAGAVSLLARASSTPMPAAAGGARGREHDIGPQPDERTLPGGRVTVRPGRPRNGSSHLCR
jgi:hypothetical protein